MGSAKSSYLAAVFTLYTRLAGRTFIVFLIVVVLSFVFGIAIGYVNHLGSGASIVEVIESIVDNPRTVRVLLPLTILSVILMTLIGLILRALKVRQYCKKNSATVEDILELDKETRKKIELW